MSLNLSRSKWLEFGKAVSAAADTLAAAEGGVAFAFIEGALVKALRDGSWLLLDEINLAPSEVIFTSRLMRIHTEVR